MERLILIRTPEELQSRGDVAGAPRFDPEDLVRHAADAHWLLIGGDEETRGRCSLWWRNPPPYGGHRLGRIGHYAARDAPAARRLLAHAGEQLRARGCTLAVGPMDGSTWRRYRLLTERGPEPVFFLEPDNPDDWPGHFREGGFTALAHYRSALCDDLTLSDPRLEQVAGRLAGDGIRLRPLDTRRLEDDLRALYGVAAVSFEGNFLYNPLAPEEFRQQYRRLLPFVRPELVLIAEQAGRCVGFLFALPDLLETRRGEEGRTVIVKTVAVLPGRAYAGLGNLLVARSHALAAELGYRRAIHALIHDANNSGNLSRRYAQTIRGYALFARTLCP